MPRTPEQNHQEAMGVLTCIRLDLGATMTMLEHLINLVPSGPNRNAITEVNITMGEMRVKLANINIAMEADDGK